MGSKLYVQGSSTSLLRTVDVQSDWIPKFVEIQKRSEPTFFFEYLFVTLQH